MQLISQVSRQFHSFKLSYKLFLTSILSVWLRKAFDWWKLSTGKLYEKSWRFQQSLLTGVICIGSCNLSQLLGNQYPFVVFFIAELIYIHSLYIVLGLAHSLCCKFRASFIALPISCQIPSIIAFPCSQDIHTVAHTHTHTNTDTQTHTQTHTHTNTYIYTYIHTHTYTHTHRHTHRHTHTPFTNTQYIATRTLSPFLSLFNHPFHSLTCSFTLLLIHTLFIHSFTHQLTNSPSHSLTHSPIHLYSFTHLLIHSFIHPLHSHTHPLIHPLTNPPTHSLIQSFTHLLTHSPAHSYNPLTSMNDIPLVTGEKKSIHQAESHILIHIHSFACEYLRNTSRFIYFSMKEKNKHRYIYIKQFTSFWLGVNLVLFADDAICEDVIKRQ